MSLSLQGLRTTIYKTTDITKAKKWYADILGVAPYFDQPFYVGFNVAGYELGLQPADNETDGSPSNVVTYWGVADVKAAYQQLLKAGATELEQPTEAGDEIEVATVYDPWGNAFGVIHNPHFKVV